MRTVGCFTVLMACFLVGLLLWNLFKYNVDLHPSTFFAIAFTTFILVVVLVVVLFFSGRK